MGSFAQQELNNNGIIARINEEVFRKRSCRAQLIRQAGGNSDYQPGNTEIDTLEQGVDLLKQGQHTQPRYGREIVSCEKQKKYKQTGTLFQLKTNPLPAWRCIHGDAFTGEAVGRARRYELNYYALILAQHAQRLKVEFEHTAINRGLFHLLINTVLVWINFFDILYLSKWQTYR